MYVMKIKRSHPLTSATSFIGSLAGTLYVGLEVNDTENIRLSFEFQDVCGPLGCEEAFH
jgi:hypothetical protein